MVEESSRVASAILAISLVGERVITVGLTAAGLVAVFVAKDNQPLVVVGGPFVVGMIITYGLHLASETRMLGGYRSAIEVELNDYYDFGVTFWESRVSPERYTRMVAFSVPFLVVSVYFAVCVVSIAVADQVPDQHARWWVVGVCASVAVSTIAIWGAWIDQRRCFGIAVDAATHHLVSIRPGDREH